MLFSHLSHQGLPRIITYQSFYTGICVIESSTKTTGATALLLLLSHSNLQICLVKWHYGKIIQNQTNPLVALTIGRGYAGKLNGHTYCPPRGHIQDSWGG